jgi:hypothetical protein
MREHRRKPHKASFLIDGSCLDGGDLMPAQALADDIQPT